VSDADVQQGITVDLVLQYGLDVQNIYASYVEVGGMNTKAEVMHYLAGSSSLLPLQRDMVAHAVNEQLNARNPPPGSTRAPYSSAAIAQANGYAVSELDGERLAEHRRPPHHGVPLPRDAEENRLASLYASGLLDRAVTGPLERLPRMARAYFDVKGAAFTLITEDELVTKSLIGTLEGAMPRDQTFCNQTIRFDRTFVVPDTHQDPQFRDSPFVTGPPFIRFYAGHPIHGPGDMRIGALCIIDDNPRTFTASDAHKLRTLAALIQVEIWAPST
jgi:GAF domain-containing protein